MGLPCDGLIHVNNVKCLNQGKHISFFKYLSFLYGKNMQNQVTFSN
jgi:hypothetical protein